MIDLVPPGHKLALNHKSAGEMLHRYGQRIGRALREIQPGQHVHVHNLSYQELETDYEFPAQEVAIPAPLKNVPTFLGYQREDGRAGTRNYIAVVAASNCAAHTAELIARELRRRNAACPTSTAWSRSRTAKAAACPADRTRATAAHAGRCSRSSQRFGGAIILGLGCEVNQIDHYLGERTRPRTDRLVGLTVQGSGGTRATVEAART